MQTKSFKLCRSLGVNFFNEAKFASKVTKRLKIKRWGKFITPYFVKKNLLQVSKFYGNDRLEKKKILLLLNVRKKQKVDLKKLTAQIKLETALLEAKFFKTNRQAKLFIRRGCVFVNGQCVTKKQFRLRAGDFVQLNLSTYNYLLAEWKSSFFFTQFESTQVFTKVPSHLEISYSGGFFVVCYSGFNK